MSERNEALLRKRNANWKLGVYDGDAMRCSGGTTVGGYRTEFMRDRDRVLYCKAFRRLAGKTQVYIGGVDDHHRTRLTHTLEVSQIARAIAAPLKLDVDLVEAIALAHDLGHTPYGHAGERTLHELMTPQERHILGTKCPLRCSSIPDEYLPFLGFKHNLQGLTVVMKLEKSYEEFGLDLTNYTHYGIQAHSGGKYGEGKVINHDKLGYYDAFLNRGCKNADGSWAWSLESLLVAEADEIAQRHHDLEDAILGGLISRKVVVQMIQDCFGDFNECKRVIAKESAILNHPDDYDMGKFLSVISRVMVDLLVTRLTKTAAYQINVLANKYGLNYTNFKDFRKAHNPDEDELRMVFSYSYTKEEYDDPNGFRNKVKDFGGEIAQRVLSSYDIQKADAKGRYIIQKLFQAYYATPQQLPDHCIYEFLSEYNKFDPQEHRGLEYRDEFRKDGESGLREKARKDGVGSVRQMFSKVFKDRTETKPVEELILMRVICNHIAGMTDAYAQKCFAELYN